MFQAPAPAENTAEFQQITQIPRNSPTQSVNYAKFAHLLTYSISILSFRSLTIDREPRKIGANQQDSAQFAHLLRELRKFRAFHSKLIHV